MPLFSRSFILGTILPFVLTACGGGGGGGGGGEGGDGNANGIGEFFKIEPNAFDIFLDHGLSPADENPDTGILKVFDGNNDGFPDLLHVANYFRLNYSGNGIAYSTMNYYENNTQGKFINKTIQIFGTNELSASPRKIKFLDINSDGLDDIFFASNREDGRSYDQVAQNIEAQNDIFISNPDGTYTKFEVGISAWSHDVQIGNIDSDSNVELIDGNFTLGTKVYDISTDGTWSDTTSQVQDASFFTATTNSLAAYSNDVCLDTISEAPAPNNLQMAYYTGDCNGSFTYVAQYGPTFTTFSVPGEVWNGDPVVFEVADISGKWITGMGLDWSHAGDFDNDGDIDVLYIIGAAEALQSEITNNYIVEGSGPTYTLITLLKNTPTGFQEVANPVINFPTDLQLYWATFADVNGNGYLDMVVDNPQGWRNGYGLNDVVFLNKGDGGFVKLDVDIANGNIIDDNLSVVPIDVNQDGIMDFVLRNRCIKMSPGCQPSDENPFELIIGIKHLPLP